MCARRAVQVTNRLGHAQANSVVRASSRTPSNLPSLATTSDAWPNCFDYLQRPEIWGSNHSQRKLKWSNGWNGSCRATERVANYRHNGQHKHCDYRNSPCTISLRLCEQRGDGRGVTLALSGVLAFGCYPVPPIKVDVVNTFAPKHSRKNLLSIFTLPKLILMSSYCTRSETFGNKR